MEARLDENKSHIILLEPHFMQNSKVHNVSLHIAMCIPLQLCSSLFSSYPILQEHE